VLIAAAGLMLAACSSDDHDGMNRSDTSPRSTTTVDIPASAEFNATDVFFAQGMIPHHGQAVQMADMAFRVSTNPDITALAQQIKAAQSPEIEQMTNWLTDWDQAVPDPDAVMDDNMDRAGGMMMSGMMSAADMRRLDNASGTDFDRMFLEMMVLHHEGAIEMAEEELAKGKYQPTKDLAQAVITGQQAEIEQMNTLIAGLPA
jgi:uncharacterized protein (DUF305 family)